MNKLKFMNMIYKCEKKIAKKIWENSNIINCKNMKITLRVYERKRVNINGGEYNMLFKKVKTLRKWKEPWWINFNVNYFGMLSGFEL